MPTALIIVDIQRDFCAGGSLAVGDADSVVPIINHLRTTLAPDLVALTQDWHPADHTSFITNNPGERLFETRRHDGQMMWPVHCVQESEGASWHKDLQTLSSDVIVRKGTKQAVDSYSGFGSKDKIGERTQLEPILRAAGITEVVVVGLAFDYCVAATAKDAAAFGFRTTLVRGASRAVAAESAAVAEKELKAAGVMVLDSYPTGQLISHLTEKAPSDKRHFSPRSKGKLLPPFQTLFLNRPAAGQGLSQTKERVTAEIQTLRTALREAQENGPEDKDVETPVLIQRMLQKIQLMDRLYKMSAWEHHIESPS